MGSVSIQSPQPEISPFLYACVDPNLAPPRRARASRRPRPNTKRIGELAESAFLHAAQLRQIRVAKPWGDSERYDFIVDAGSRFWRVQIKATATQTVGGYEVQATYCVGKRKGHLTPDDIDLFATYILPLDVWYFVPADALPPSASLRFYPHRRARHARFEQYRDAWHYLLPDPRRSSGDLEWFLYPARTGPS
jgi:hypothetical protein